MSAARQQIVRQFGGCAGQDVTAIKVSSGRANLPRCRAWSRLRENDQRLDLARFNIAAIFERLLPISVNKFG